MYGNSYNDIMDSTQRKLLLNANISRSYGSPYETLEGPGAPRRSLSEEGSARTRGILASTSRHEQAPSVEHCWPKLATQ